MRKIIFLLVMISSFSVNAQINPTDFPKIGFTDLYWLKCLPTYYGYNYNAVNYVDSSYYYPRLNELGLNYVVTLGNPNGPLNSNYNNSIKIIDNDFRAFIYQAYNFYDSQYDLSQITYSTGNDKDFNSYQAGGGVPSSMADEDQNFGFGTDAGENSAYSFWLKNRTNTIGETNHYDVANLVYTFYAGVAEHSEGYILRGEFPPLHQNTGHGGKNYYLSIISRINPLQNGNPTDTVAIVYFDTTSSVTENAIQRVKQNVDFFPFSIETEQITSAIAITANQFNGNGDYTNIVIPFIKPHPQNYGDLKLKVDILWKDKRDLFIDKIAIYNKYYDSLFIKPSAVQTSIRNRIKSVLTNKFQSRSSNPLWAHLYHDEAMPLTFRCNKEVSELAELPNVLGAGKYVTGVNNSGWFSYDEMRFAYNIWRPPYLMYDDYPIISSTDTVSTNPSSGKHTIQQALQRLVAFDWGYNSILGQHKNGIKYSIELANNQTFTDYSDDVPFYHTLQVCAQKKVSLGVVTKIDNREPKPNEILAQGWLALCYGAKGLMYYTVFTNTPNNYSISSAQYGLFSSLGQENQNCQDPALPQVPNERFYAVKELNQQIDAISSTLLQLTWYNGFSMHNDTSSLSSTYISSIRSYSDEIPSEGTLDPSNETFVELGLFKKTTEFGNSHLDYFIIKELESYRCWR